MKRLFVDLLISVLSGLGIISLISPLFFYWWIHGNYERYIWIISGPAPYGNFGGGPYQFFYLLLVPIVLGLILVGASLIIRKIFK